MTWSNKMQLLCAGLILQVMLFRISNRIVSEILMMMISFLRLMSRTNHRAWLPYLVGRASNANLATPKKRQVLLSLPLSKWNILKVSGGADSLCAMIHLHTYVRRWNVPCCDFCWRTSWCVPSILLISTPTRLQYCCGSRSRKLVGSNYKLLAPRTRAMTCSTLTWRLHEQRTVEENRRSLDWTGLSPEC